MYKRQVEFRAAAVRLVDARAAMLADARAATCEPDTSPLGAWTRCASCTPISAAIDELCTCRTMWSAYGFAIHSAAATRLGGGISHAELASSIERAPRPFVFAPPFVAEASLVASHHAQRQRAEETDLAAPWPGFAQPVLDVRALARARAPTSRRPLVEAVARTARLDGALLFGDGDGDGGRGEGGDGNGSGCLLYTSPSPRD